MTHVLRTSRVVLAAAAVFAVWPGIGACAPGPGDAEPTPVAATATVPAQAPAPALTPALTIDGLGLDLPREQVLAAIRARGVTDQEHDTFKDGSEELRFWLTDGAFLRIVFPDAAPTSTPRAILVSGPETAAGADLRARFIRMFGQPSWTYGKGERLIWNGRGEEEGVVIPRPGAAFVAELDLFPQMTPSYVLARPSWYQSKGN